MSDTDEGGFWRYLARPLVIAAILFQVGCSTRMSSRSKNLEQLIIKITNQSSDTRQGTLGIEGQVTGVNSSLFFQAMSSIYPSHEEILADTALNLIRNGGPTSELSSCIIELAEVYMDQMKFEKAQPLYEKAIELQNKAFEEEHGYLMDLPEVAIISRTLSSVYKEQGKFDDAKSALNRAVAIMRKYHTSDNQFIAPYKVDMARLMVEQGNLKKAETIYLRELDIIDNSYGPNHPYTARVHGFLAELYALQGRYSEAEPLINETLAIQEETYGPEHHFLTSTWLTLARIYHGTGKYEKAQELFDKSLSVIGKIGTKGMILKVEKDIASIQGK